MKNIIVSFLCVFAFTLFTNAQTAWNGNSEIWEKGSGTQTDPIQIETPENLAYLSETVNNGESYFGKYFIVVNDLYLNKYNFTIDGNGNLDIENMPSFFYKYYIKCWNPIGSKNNKFQGIFDGNNKTISGMYIFYDKDKVPEHAYVGLFGYVTDTIKNLTLSNSYIGNEYDAPALEANGGVGSIVSYMDNSALVNCHTTSSVTLAGKGSGVMGGLVANITDVNFTSSLISNCSNRANIFAKISTFSTECNIGGIAGKSTGTISGNPFGKCENYGNITIERIYGYSEIIAVGGIIGKLSANATDSKIVGCENHGDIVVKTGISNEKYYIGGVVGINEGGQVDVCHNCGKISGADGRIGGLVGVMKDKSIHKGRIVNACVEGMSMNISEGGRGSSKAFGGIVGWMEGDSYIDKSVVKNSKIFGKVVSTDNASLEMQVGGLVGCMNGNAKIINSSMVDDEMEIQVVASRGSLKIDVGGIVGRISGSGHCVVDRCSYNGNIEISSTELKHSSKQIVAEVGAIVGLLESGCVKNTQSHSIVKYNGSHVNTISSFGGIAGRNLGNIVNCFGSDSLFAIKPHTARNVGGIAGANAGNIVNCYHRGYYEGNVMSAGGIAGKNENNGVKGSIIHSYYKNYIIRGVSMPLVDKNYKGIINSSGSFKTSDGMLVEYDNAIFQYGKKHLEALNSAVVNLNNDKTFEKLLGWREDIFNVNEGYPVFDTLGSTILPVELMFFKGKCVNNTTKLYWSTASETNNNLFVVRKSSNGTNFTDIGIVDGYGNTSSQKDYNFIDNNCINTLNYYQLVQIDFDGKTTVYDPISIACGEEKNDEKTKVVISPNPFTNYFSIEFNIDMESDFLVEVYDNQSKVIFSKNFSAIDANEAIDISLPNLPAGIYYLQIKDSNRTFGEKLIKK